MTTPGKLIPTAAQLRLVLLGKLGRGPAELVHMMGAAVDAGYDYAHCVEAVPVALAALVAEGKAECGEIGSPFCSVTYKSWRLAGSTPMESPAAPVAVPAGHISAADFMRSGAKNTQRKRK